jgi:hypothetical protein
MARATPNYEGRAEFWKPAARTEAGTARATLRPQCRSCGAECVPDSLYCHVCGSDRQAAVNFETGFRVPAAVRLASRAVGRLASHSMAGFASRFAILRDALGQTNVSMTALLGGCACLVAAAATGLVFNAATLLDWQALQLWRIEWLLAAVALLLAGVLVKKK